MGSAMLGAAASGLCGSLSDVMVLLIMDSSYR